LGTGGRGLFSCVFFDFGAFWGGPMGDFSAGGGTGAAGGPSGGRGRVGFWEGGEGPLRIRRGPGGPSREPAGAVEGRKKKNCRRGGGNVNRLHFSFRVGEIRGVGVRGFGATGPLFFGWERSGIGPRGGLRNGKGGADGRSFLGPLWRTRVWCFCGGTAGGPGGLVGSWARGPVFGISGRKAVGDSEKKKNRVPRDKKEDLKAGSQNRTGDVERGVWIVGKGGGGGPTERPGLTPARAGSGKHSPGENSPFFSRIVLQLQVGRGGEWDGSGRGG